MHYFQIGDKLKRMKCNDSETYNGTSAASGVVAGLIGNILSSDEDTENAIQKIKYLASSRLAFWRNWENRHFEL